MSAISPPTRVRLVLTRAPVLAELFEAGVQVAEVRDAAHDRLAIELDDQPQHAMRGGMLRADVDEHMLGTQIGLCGRRERDTGRAPLSVHSRRGQLELDGALAHAAVGGGSGITPRSPRRSRSRMSSGRSPAASAIDSSSSE